MSEKVKKSVTKRDKIPMTEQQQRYIARLSTIYSCGMLCGMTPEDMPLGWDDIPKEVLHEHCLWVDGRLAPDD